MKRDEDKFFESCEEARKFAFSFDDPLIVHHYDSVDENAKMIVSYKEEVRKVALKELFEICKNQGIEKREDGKEIIKPKELICFAINNNNEIIKARVKTIIRHLTKKSMIKICNQMSEVLVTEDHSLMSLDNGKLIEKKPTKTTTVASPRNYLFFDIKPDVDLIKNKLAVTTHRKINKNEFVVPNKKVKKRIKNKVSFDEEFLTFLGMWIADGCFMHRKGREGVRISCYEHANTREIIDQIFLRFGTKATITDNGITAVTCNKTFYNLMRFLGFIDGSHSKFVPQWIFGLQENLMSGFLRGYFSGDGTVSKGEINATTMSKKLKDDIRDLLLFFGIRARVRKDGEGYKISINSRIWKEIFIKKIRFLQEEKNRKIVLGEKTRIKESKIYLENIKIEKQKEAEGYVYDIETEVGNFVCERIVLKNTDGITSGAIVSGSLAKEGKRFRMDCIRKLDDGAIERYLKEKEIIFVDLGGGNKRVNELKDVLIIDHHQTQGIGKFQVNPLLFGIDGGRELSAASTAYCVFRKYADLAIVGATGDMQSPMTGMNRWVVSEGEKNNEIIIETDLRFYGRYCRPLVQFLAYSDDPYIPGISFREDRAAQLLDDLKIKTEDEAGKKKTYADLAIGEKQKLVSAIANMLTNSTDRKIELVGESYIFPHRQRNETFEANEFSTLLNACGRHDKPELGVKICLGDSSAYEEARNLLALHRRMLREGVEYALSAAQDLGKFYFLDGRGIIDESILGIVCGMMMGQKKEKPIIGISLSDKNTIKISGRASKGAVTKGVNVGNLMRDASAALGGVGGGHVMAAGAAIPRDKINEFLLFCNRNLKDI